MISLHYIKPILHAQLNLDLNNWFNLVSHIRTDIKGINFLLLVEISLAFSKVTRMYCFVYKQYDFIQTWIFFILNIFVGVSWTSVSRFILIVHHFSLISFYAIIRQTWLFKKKTKKMPVIPASLYKCSFVSEQFSIRWISGSHLSTWAWSKGFYIHSKSALYLDCHFEIGNWWRLNTKL